LRVSCQCWRRPGCATLERPSSEDDQPAVWCRGRTRRFCGGLLADPLTVRRGSRDWCSRLERTDEPQPIDGATLHSSAQIREADDCCTCLMQAAQACRSSSMGERTIWRQPTSGCTRGRRRRGASLSSRDFPNRHFGPRQRLSALDPGSCCETIRTGAVHSLVDDASRPGWGRARSRLRSGVCRRCGDDSGVVDEAAEPWVGTMSAPTTRATPERPGAATITLVRC
jgi:hypothetical protein